MAPVDFEFDSLGSTYSGTGWNIPVDVTATVVSISSVVAGSGLPANGDSVNVLKVQTNWGAIPKFTVTIPGGKTLADYKVVFNAYFPNSSLGLSSVGDNYYKDLYLLADTTVSGAVGSSNPAFQSVSTGHAAWNEIDKWLTMELSVDPAKAAILTGTIEIALGLYTSHESPDNAYYLDNITLVELP